MNEIEKAPDGTIQAIMFDHKRGVMMGFLDDTEFYGDVEKVFIQALKAVTEHYPSTAGPTVLGYAEDVLDAASARARRDRAKSYKIIDEYRNNRAAAPTSEE